MNPETTIALAFFAAGLAERLNEYKTRMGLTYFDRFEVIIDPPGKRYTKVHRQELLSDGSPYGAGKSIVCFIENATGAILQPASWAVPAKHARGSIFSDQQGMEAIDASGHIKYLR